MPLVRNSMGYSSALPCGDAADDWCSGAEYHSWYETARHYIPQLVTLAEGPNPAIGVRAGSLIARFQIFPERGGTLLEFPSSLTLDQPTTLQLAQLAQAMFDLIEETGGSQPIQVQRNENLPTPSEGLTALGWGLAIGAVATALGYFYLRGLD
jgi:hypothetical protein